MSLFGDIIGGFGASHASKNIATGYQNAENGITGTITQGLGRMDNALGTARSDITGAASGYQPYIGAGNAGLSGLQNYASSPDSHFSFDPSQYFNSDAYKFQLAAGNENIQNSAAAAGTGNSSNVLRDFAGYGQGLAAQYYNDAFNRAQQSFNTNQNATLANLSTLIGAGEFGQAGNTNALTNLAGLNLQGTEAENNFQLGGSKLAGDYAVGLGNAMANHTMAGYNAWGNIAGDIAGLASPLVGSIPTGSGSATTLAGIFG